jgi:hypothetical protein
MCEHDTIILEKYDGFRPAKLSLAINHVASA